MTSFRHLRVTQNMYAHRMVSLTAATSLENLRALNEVRDFATTDMGLGGPELWTYRILQEPGLSTELQRLANPLSVGGIDAIDFQPCQLHEFRTQDRKCIEHWQMPPGGGTWVFTAIFDGQCIWSRSPGPEVLDVVGCDYALCAYGRTRRARHRGACVSDAPLHDQASARRVAPPFVAAVPRARRGRILILRRCDLRNPLRLHHQVRPLHHERLYPHLSRRSCRFAGHVQHADPPFVPGSYDVRRRPAGVTTGLDGGDAMPAGKYGDCDAYGPFQT